MGTSNPSRPKGIRAAGRAGSGKVSVHLVTLTLDGDSGPLVETRGGASVPTPDGRAVSEAWRALGKGRPGVETDAFALDASSLRGILRLPADDPSALSAAIRLFKVTAARAVRAARQGAGMEEFEAAGMWKRGYAERTLATLKQVVEARKSLVR